MIEFFPITDTTEESSSENCGSAPDRIRFRSDRGVPVRWEGKTQETTLKGAGGGILA